MELNLVKENFADNFLSVISKAVDVAAVKANKEGLHVICNKPDTSIIVLGKYNTPLNLSEEISLNLGDIKKLLRVIDCIELDNLKFDIKNNHLYYNDGVMQFKYHFLDDAIIPKVTTKKEKIEALELDTFFDVEFKKLQEILKASSFTTDTNKIYLFGKGTEVYCELGDKEKNNTDSISLKVSEKVEGLPFTQVLPFNLDIFRVLAGVKFDKARVGINHKLKVMSFYVRPTEETEFKFIISGLVK